MAGRRITARSDADAMTTASDFQAVVSVIRALGFVGNAHYCPACLNQFHEDRGQHTSDCPVPAELAQDEDWWLHVEMTLNGAGS